jgi:hypothetical protein
MPPRADLEVWKPPQIDVRLTQHPLQCEAAECTVPAAMQAIVLADDWGQMAVVAVCAGHLQVLRGHRGFQAYPFGGLPPFDAVLATVTTEIERRIRAQQQATARWIHQQTGTVTMATGNFTMNYV